MGVSKLVVLIGVAVLVQSSYSAPPPTTCACTREYLPRCGTDDVTYYNNCLFQCEKSRNKDLEIKFYGECDDEEKVLPIEDLCACTEDYYPVCGNDNQTYSNECMLNCEQRKRKDLKLKYIGECGTEVRVPEGIEYQVEDLQSDVCVCTRVLSPVCGSDHHTYANPCTFNCAKMSNKNLKISYQGECNDHVLPFPIEDCACTEEYFPVCGNDNETYSNECMLNCEKRKRTDLSLKYVGECQEATPYEANECACSRVFTPLCGTDSITYANQCMFNCAKKNNKSLEVKHQGECSEVPHKDIICKCPEMYIPFCGTDNKTYGNQCLLFCAQMERADLQIQYKGVCHQWVGRFSS